MTWLISLSLSHTQGVDELTYTPEKMKYSIKSKQSKSCDTFKHSKRASETELPQPQFTHPQSK